MAVEWSYYEKFDEMLEKHLPVMGEGESLGSQIVTAVNKLIYKWYNDGDVYDNTGFLKGWCNDLSSYANWLDTHCKLEIGNKLSKIYEIHNEIEYEDLLKNVADVLFESDFIEFMSMLPKDGSIYSCKGKFRFVDNDESEDDWEC